MTRSIGRLVFFANISKCFAEAVVNAFQTFFHFVPLWDFLFVHLFEGCANGLDL